MTRKGKLLLIITFAIAIAGVFTYLYLEKKKTEFVCLNGQTAIYEKYKNAVVLVSHVYTIEFSIKGSKPFTLDIDDYMLRQDTIYGTGFFVSKKGKIITNHHVSEPWLYDENRNALEYLKARIAALLPDSVAENDRKAFLEKNWENYDEFEEEEENDSSVTTDVAHNDTIQPGTAVADSTIVATKASMISTDDIEISYRSVSIQVALHDSYEEWLECNPLKAAEDKNVDVAVLQLKSKKLPASVKEYIDLSNAYTEDNNIKPGTKAILIGYPMGMTLASTARGIKVQVYEGQINKETDGTSIQYNITSTHGASGSPVFNECGQLIAVNYAGFDEAQGYNFGIVAKYAEFLAR